MSGIGDNSGHQMLRAFIERVMRLKEEQDALADDIREVYAEAKSSGFDKTAMGQLVAYLRKKDKNADKLAEQSALFDLYLEAYERPSHAHTREGAQIEGERTHLDRGMPAAPSMQGGQTNSNPRPTSLPEADKGEALTSSPVASPAPSSAVSVGGVDEVASESRNNLEEGAKPAPSLPDDFEPPAFLAKKHVLRPHCLHPELCAGSGSNHCHECRKAMSGDEVSA